MGHGARRWEGTTVRELSRGEECYPCTAHDHEGIMLHFIIKTEQ